MTNCMKSVLTYLSHNQLGKPVSNIHIDSYSSNEIEKAVLELEAQQMITILRRKYVDEDKERLIVTDITEYGYSCLNK